MKKLIVIIMLALTSSTLLAQASWSEADRKYLLDNLARSRDELMTETLGLSKEQWSFKESSDRWSINELVEHIARWEMLFDFEISKALSAGKQPERMKNAKADSTFFNFIMEQKKHYSLDYTKPFSFTIPMGLNDPKSNEAWFLKMRNESEEYVKSTQDDLRAYFNSYGSIHQIYIYVFGHTDRHIRQIKKVKQHPKYPK